MEVKIEPYQSKDKSDLLQMMESFNALEQYNFDRETAEKNVDEFTSQKSLGRCYLIKRQKENIGYLILTFGYSFEYHGKDAFIDELFLVEGQRNRGIGKMAMNFLEKEAAKLQVKAIHLEVEARNLHARQLYLKQGYVANSRTLLTKRLSN